MSVGHLQHFENVEAEARRYHDEQRRLTAMEMLRLLYEKNLPDKKYSVYENVQLAVSLSDFLLEELAAARHEEFKRAAEMSKKIEDALK